MQWEQGFKRRWSPPLITCFTLWCKVDSHDVNFLLTVFLRLLVLSTRKKQKVRFSTFHASVPFRYPPPPPPKKITVFWIFCVTLQYLNKMLPRSLNFYNSWKHQKSRSFLKLSRVIETESPSQHFLKHPTLTWKILKPYFSVENF